MFSFRSPIVKRRRFSKTSLFFGLLSIAGLVYGGYTYFQFGQIPLIEEIMAQLGVAQYVTWVYLTLLVSMFLLVLSAIYTIFKKKVVIGGEVAFNEERLKIVYGSDKYDIPESQLQHLDFEIKKLPEGKTKDSDKLFGGSWMKIPTQKGIFKCELDINTPQQRMELMEMIEFLKIEHDVEVKVKEIK